MGAAIEAIQESYASAVTDRARVSVSQVVEVRRRGDTQAAQLEQPAQLSREEQPHVRLAEDRRHLLLAERLGRRLAGAVDVDDDLARRRLRACDAAAAPRRDSLPDELHPNEAVTPASPAPSRSRFVRGGSYVDACGR